MECTNVGILYIDALKHIKALYEAGELARYKTGEYAAVVSLHEKGDLQIAAKTEDELAKELMNDMKGLAFVRKKLRMKSEEMVPRITKIFLHFGEEESYTIPFNFTIMGDTPIAWLLLGDGTSLVILHKAGDVFVLQHQCTDEDYENNAYSETDGVIKEYSGNIHGIFQKLKTLVNQYGYADREN